jgi:hypothetical protein
MKLSSLSVLALAAVSFGCSDTSVTRLGPAYPAKQDGCALEIFPATVPPYPYVDIASARALCWRDRSVCIDRLRREACATGADTIYAFSEAIDKGTALSATFARRMPRQPAAAAPVPAPAAAAPMPALGAAGADACNPICSPGFACKVGVCEPQCNPACEAGEICTRKRVCEPATPAK